MKASEIYFKQGNKAKKMYIFFYPSTEMFEKVSKLLTSRRMNWNLFAMHVCKFLIIIKLNWAVAKIEIRKKSEIKSKLGPVST